MPCLALHSSVVRRSGHEWFVVAWGCAKLMFDLLLQGASQPRAMSWHVHEAVICPLEPKCHAVIRHVPGCCPRPAGQPSHSLGAAKVAGVRVSHVAIVGPVGFLLGMSRLF